MLLEQAHRIPSQRKYVHAIRKSKAPISVHGQRGGVERDSIRTVNEKESEPIADDQCASIRVGSMWDVGFSLIADEFVQPSLTVSHSPPQPLPGTGPCCITRSEVRSPGLLAQARLAYKGASPHARRRLTKGRDPWP